MIVDQDEINALLAQADQLVHEAEVEDVLGPPAQVAATPPPKAAVLRNVTPQVARLLRIRVPVVVQLAKRKMGIAIIRKLSLGMIIEFHKGIDQPLTLLINNHPIGTGDTVKVGEHFGIRIQSIGDQAARIRSMGK